MRTFVRTPYMKQLDGLRAFAVLFTMITHFTLSSQGILGRVPWGLMGVRLFFVLSGFLITGILLRSRPWENRTESLRIFYCRRFLRIFPVYYATIAITALVNIRPVRQTLWWHLCYLSNIYQVVCHPSNSPVTHFWSLAVEEQFYLIWPCLILFVSRRYLFKVMVATVCIGPLWRLVAVLLHVSSADTLMLGCLDTLGMGALLAYFSDRDFSTTRMAARFDRLTFSVGTPAVALLLTTQAMHVESQWTQVLADLALAFGFVWLVSQAARSFHGPIGAVLEFGPIRYVGRISYGVYVLHAFMPVVLFYILKWAGLSWPDTSPVKFVVLVAMSIAAAGFSWRFLESPINAYKRHFDYPRAMTRTEISALAPMAAD